MCTPPDAGDLMPYAAGGWARDGDDGHYTFDTLYDLIDGGAEVYRSFGVVRVVSRRYARPGAPGILADLFDMGSPPGAYGVYHHDTRDGRAAGLGDESEQAGAAVAFRSDRYFVSVVALEETPGSVAGVLAVARAIAARLPAGAAVPEVVRLLPEQGLLRGRVVYVRDAAYLRTRYDFGDAATPALPPGSEGALARYRDTAGACVLMLVRYPTAAQAGAATKAFRAAWLPRGDGRRTGVTAADDLLVAVLESDEPPDMKAIAAAILGRRARPAAAPDAAPDPARTGDAP
jgi:hypothetical protein